jgi:transposase InsO family protein
MVDIASRWVEVDIVFEITSEQIIKSISQEIINKHGSPRRLLSDQGRQFISLKFKEFIGKHNIKHVLTNAHNPTANSIVERINQSIGNIARICKGFSLKELKEKICTHLNYSTNRTTKYSPFEIIYKHSPFDILRRKLQNVQEEQCSRTNASIEREVARRNKNRVKHLYITNDLVYKKNFSPDKLDDKWLGPFKILNVINENMVEIQEVGKSTLQNVKNLKPDFFSRRQNVVTKCSDETNGTM